MFGAIAFAARPFAAARLAVTSGGITGAAAALTLASFAGVAAGTVTVAGGASLTLPGIAGAAAGTVKLAGSAALATLVVTGAGAGTVAPLVVSFTPSTVRTLAGGNDRGGAGGFARLLHGGFDRGLGDG